jgi:hypothetical protein
MTRLPIVFWPLWLLPLCLLFPLLCAAEQFVEVTAEIDCDDWDWWFFSDKINSYPGSDKAPSIFHANQVFHCVVGADTWLIERSIENRKISYWFTGTNLIAQIAISNQHPYTSVYGSVDGNPGRPGGVADLMTFDATARICWLAFCSGTALKREGRQLYPPSDFWKESRLVYSGWSDHTAVFKDDLGLPKSITLFATNNQPVVQYQTRQSTNVLGWNFPLEFYLVQYKPTGTNEWVLALTAKGRLTSVGVGRKPEFPPEAMKPDWIEK